MQERWQLYNPKGQPLAGQGTTKDEAFGQGLLHGAAHVWIWRKRGRRVEVLLQKRASSKRTFPNLYDISAAGHIDLGESPVEAAIRETKEEIGLDIDAAELNFVGVLRTRLTAAGGEIENELRWVYLVELSDEPEFVMQKKEVEALTWQPLPALTAAVMAEGSPGYVPQGLAYYKTVTEALAAAAKL